MRHPEKKHLAIGEKANKNYSPKRFSSEEEKNNRILPQLIISTKSGIGGFFIVFSLIILMKLLSLAVNHTEIFAIGTNDIIFSFWGFIIISFIIFSEKYR